MNVTVEIDPELLDACLEFQEAVEHYPSHSLVQEVLLQEYYRITSQLVSHLNDDVLAQNQENG